jgi:CheY-like chemotaxis protein
MNPQPATARVLIASANADDAEQILHQLQPYHEHVKVSTGADRAVRDFEEFRPDVLVLAFDSIEQAQRYSLGLYRRGATSRLQRHRTVLLCTKDEVTAAFDLCRQGFFDDYVLFWPLSQDGRRLAMSVWIAAREALSALAAPSRDELASHASQLGQLDSVLGRQLAEGSRHATTAAHALETVRTVVDTTIDEFAQRLGASGDGNAMGPVERATLSRELQRLKADRIDHALSMGAQSVSPAVTWPRDLEQKLRPHLSNIRGFATRINSSPRQVLVVDDDELMHTLVRNALRDSGYELHFATDGAKALATLRHSRPDLILMDIGLPDIGGVDLTARLKGDADLSNIVVLMLTGDSRRETIAKSVSAGAAGFIVKPFTREALAGKIAQFLGAPSLSA